MVCRDLDLFFAKEKLYVLSASTLLAFYQHTLLCWKPQLGRFVGFKSSHGVLALNQDPYEVYGPQWLFSRPTRTRFVCPYDGVSTAMVTGIYHSEDISEWFQNNPLMHRFVDKEILILKKMGHPYDHSSN